MPLVMPTTPSPGTAGSVLTASGISDTALINIGGNIRRAGGSESLGRTIAGGMRLSDRYYSMKSEGELKNIYAAQNKAVLDQYVKDMLAQGYKQKNPTTLEKDVGGGLKEVITLDYNTGQYYSANAQTDAALRAARDADMQTKRARNISINYYEAQALGSMESFFRNKAYQAKTPEERQAFLDAAERAKGKALTSTSTSTSSSPGVSTTTTTKSPLDAADRLILQNIPLTSTGMITAATTGRPIDISRQISTTTVKIPTKAKHSSVSAIRRYTSSPITESSTARAVRAVEAEKARGGSNADVINRIMASGGWNRRIYPDNNSKSRKVESDPIKRLLNSELPRLRRKGW